LVNTENSETEKGTGDISPEKSAGEETAPGEKEAATEIPTPEEITTEKTSPVESPPEETAPESTVKEASIAESAPPRRGGAALSFFALVISLVALAGAAWMWWQDQSETRQEEQRVLTEIARLESNDSELSLKLNQVRNEVESLAGGDAGAEFEALQRRLQADRSKLNNVEKAIGEQLKLSRSLQEAAESMQERLVAAEAALSGMAGSELDAGGELDIAEVDYLLRLANERLQLFSDPEAADQALEVADMHLAALDKPMYLGVRQDIAAARRDLAAVRIPDYLAITNQLDSIQRQIASLPFHGEGPVVTESTPVEGDGWWQKVKNVFSGLVTVRRSTEEENERISLQDKDFIRQRVWLQLEIAHLSLMRRDQEAFRTSLNRVQASLSEWFDDTDDKFQEVMRGIESLSALEVQVDVPDITAPWSSLNVLKASLPRPAAAPLPVEDTPTVRQVPGTEQLPATEQGAAEEQAGDDEQDSEDDGE
jgi:uroporphyrin-3 C-methyltransferase